MHLLSIVIPCFNCENSLRACIDSVSDDPRIEIILVDDCSTDRTVSIMESYQSKMHSYNLIISSNSQNLGPGETRNKGVHIATGEYVTFLDSDDAFLPGACHIILEELGRHAVDCLFFDAEIEKSGSTKYLNMFDTAVKSKKPISQEHAIVYGRGCTCGKAYRRSIIVSNNVRFSDVPIGEDVAFSKNAYACCVRFGHIEKALYLYKENFSSQMHKSELVNEENYLKTYEEIKSVLTARGKLDELNNLYYQCTVYPTMIAMLRNGRELNACKVRFKEMICLYDRKDKYFSGMSLKYRIAYYLFSFNLFWMVRYALNNTQ